MYRSHIDTVLAKLFATLASLVGAMLLLVLVFLLWESRLILKDNGWLKFFTDANWFPLENMFGIMPMVWASLAVALGAIILAAPIGIASALFGVWGAMERRTDLGIFKGQAKWPQLSTSY